MGTPAPKAIYYTAALGSGKLVGIGYSPGEIRIDIVTGKRRRSERGGRFAGAYAVYGLRLRPLVI